MPGAVQAVLYHSHRSLWAGVPAGLPDWAVPDGRGQAGWAASRMSPLGGRNAAVPLAWGRMLWAVLSERGTPVQAAQRQ